MRSRTWLCLFAGAALFALGMPWSPATARPPEPTLEMYTLEGTTDSISRAVPGLERAGLRHTANGVRANAVLTGAQRDKLAAAGVGVTVTRNAEGQTVTQQAAAQAENGFTVWRSWDEAG